MKSKYKRLRIICIAMLFFSLGLMAATGNRVEWMIWIATGMIIDALDPEIK